ncbi:ribosomal protein S18-alanine N-acetyltransferase [Wenzhouxiangella sp. XN79A]|uniref:ribosomal protein S18-alanine N-acetyltransferase n=1 Tax=Wenzhouxiangella sp. XN79A TaxID=2724193 RepID=UPI00144A51AB|nr:ribosomal protein S18-alanine N-acetyltransferase [Wenzhouxiangella sp. XN79A]NKI35048.1 ribosomal protein S18-alanine N-acetyltransferase [Wenzhouxiangella sp. XN79A]
MVAVLQPRVELRPMRRDDLDAVHEVEAASYPFPWTRGVFADCLRMGYCCRVAAVDGDLAGYMILSAGAGEAHLLNLCVAPAMRGAGIARVLLDGALVEARLLRTGRLFLEVRPSNARAVELYRRNGFRTIGKRPGYYPAEGGREDALVMVRHLDAARSGAPAR